MGANYWEPVTFLGAHGEHTFLIEGLAQVTGGQLHTEGGIIRIDVVTITSGGSLSPRG